MIMKTRMRRAVSTSAFSFNSNSNSNNVNHTKNPSRVIGLKFSFSLPRGASTSPASNASNAADFVSPVPHLLHSNVPPTDAERLLILDAIDRVSAESEVLLAELNATPFDKPCPTTLSRLETCASFVEAHKGILSPIRLLPEEILADIFTIYSESFLLEEHPHIITLSMQGVTYPWIPSQVCRNWRSAALSLHHLWGQLIVDTCLWKSNVPSKAFLGLFATLVDRSHDAPLCIYFCTPPSADVEDLRPIIDVLASHSERWSTVYLITPYSVVNAFQRIKGRLSALSRLYLSFAVEKHIMSTNDTVLDVFQEAPKLRSIYLSSSSFSGRVLLPYDQFLVFLDGGERSNGRAREQIVPASSSTLMDLQFARFPMEDLQKPWPRTTLSQLIYLDVKFENISDEEDPYDNLQDNFFSSLSLPSIHNIRIANYPKNLLPVLSSLIIRSFPSQQCTTLQELSFSTYFLAEYDPGELAAFLELTPYLKKLSVYLPHTTDLARLVVDCENDSPLLPHLEELCLFVYDSVAGYQDVLSSIASTRCEPAPSDNCSSTSLRRPARLRHFRLIFPGAVLCHAGHEMLESFNSWSLLRTHSPSSASSKALDERVSALKDWTPLASSLPSIFAYFWSASGKLGLAKIKRAFQVSQWFSTVEGVKIEGVKELYLSDIHHLMYHISSLSSSEIPGDNIYHFRKRARALLDKWSTFLTEDIKNRKWAFQGAQSVVYVPQDHEVRSRLPSEAIISMIYGDKFYPHKYSVSWYDLQVVLQYQD